MTYRFIPRQLGIRGVPRSATWWQPMFTLDAFRGCSSVNLLDRTITNSIHLFIEDVDLTLSSYSFPVVRCTP